MGLQSNPMQDLRRLASRLDRGVGAAVVSGLLYALAQPNWGLWPLAAVCMIPLFRSMAGARARRRIWLAYLFGTVWIMGLYAQALGVGVPSQLLSSLPYLVTIAALVVISGNRILAKVNTPACIGQPFVPER